MKRQIRKQVDELRTEDFEAYSCWEYAADEEGRKGQDECTVRPLDPSLVQSNSTQTFVQAVFFFPGGRVRLGMVTLNAGGDPSGHQPAVFLGKDTLCFFNGSSEPGKKEVRAFRKALEKVSSTLFPIRYVSSLQTPEGRPLAYGELHGLYWLANWRTNELRAAA